MSAEDNKVIAQGYFEKLINAHNVDAIDDLFDPNVDFYDPSIWSFDNHQ